MVTLQFFSDTNFNGALDELGLLQLDSLTTGNSTLGLEIAEYASLEEPITDIVKSWGGAIHISNQ